MIHCTLYLIHRMASCISSFFLQPSLKYAPLDDPFRHVRSAIELFVEFVHYVRLHWSIFSVALWQTLENYKNKVRGSHFLSLPKLLERDQTNLEEIWKNGRNSENFNIKKACAKQERDHQSIALWGGSEVKI